MMRTCRKSKKWFLVRFRREWLSYCTIQTQISYSCILFFFTHSRLVHRALYSESAYAFLVLSCRSGWQSAVRASDEQHASVRQVVHEFCRECAAAVHSRGAHCGDWRARQVFPRTAQALQALLPDACVRASSITTVVSHFVSNTLLYRILNTVVGWNIGIPRYGRTLPLLFLINEYRYNQEKMTK